MKIKPLLLALIIPFTASATPNRGLWFWGSTSIPDGAGDEVDSPYGSNLVVGNPTLERDCLAFFKLHHVKRIYGSYGNRPVSEQATIASWNEKLDCLRIDSQVLIAGSLVSSSDHSYYLTRVTNRLINFNNDFITEPAKQFDALHLDIEPQQQNPWKVGSGAVRRAFLEDLLNTYTAIRAHLDANGYNGFPIYADIPYTWDKFPGSIAWADATDRDTWFLNLKSVLTGLSIMTFSKTNAPALDVATAYERTGALDGFSRIGIQPKVGDVSDPDIYWPDYPRSTEFSMIWKHWWNPPRPPISRILASGATPLTPPVSATLCAIADSGSGSTIPLKTTPSVSSMDSASLAIPPGKTKPSTSSPTVKFAISTANTRIVRSPSPP